MCERNNSADTRASAEGRGGGCDPVETLHWSRLMAGPAVQRREESTLEQVAGRACDPVGHPRRSSLFLKCILHAMEGTHAGAVCEEVRPMERTHIGAVHGEFSPVGEIPRWSRGRE